MDEKTGTTGSDRPEQNRDDRLKAALKANLARRKRQARARGAQSTGTEARPDENED